MEIVDSILGFGGHGRLNPSYVCIHETAGPGAPAVNLVSWWRGGGGLPVHYVGDWTGKCYYCVPEDEVCWQVGNGNPYVIGIELCHATNQRDFDAVWQLGVEWAAWQLSKRGWGIDRLISHYDCTIRWGGSDHTDPIGYFEEFGRSWGEFVADVDAYMRGGGKKSKSKRGNKMQCLIQPNGEPYMVYFDGVNAHPLANPDEMIAIQEVYKRCNDGEDMPCFAFGAPNAPWATRLFDGASRKWGE